MSEERMYTALLIDGTDNPVGLRIGTFDKNKPYIAWGRAGQPPQNFKYVFSEGEEKDILVFRLVGGKMTDDEFMESAAFEVDKIVDPDKYRKLERQNEDARRRQAATA